MSTPTRRTFIKTGIAAGAIVPTVTAVPALAQQSREGRPVRTTHDFDILGMKGQVTLETDEALPAGAAFSVEVTPFAAKKALARIRMKPGTRLTIRQLSIQISVPNADVNRIWYTQQIDGLGHHAYISLPWGATIDASGHFGCLLTALQDRYGQNRGLLALKNQSGDGSLHFSVEYGGPAMRMTINRFVHGGVWHADEIDETAYVDIEDVPWNHAVDAFSAWYDKEFKLTYDIPRFCWEPAFNTWYPIKNEQYEADVLRLARQCRDLGIGMFEIDAGWFTSAATWQLNTKKIPDLKALVKKLHALGLKVIIWYSAFDSGGSKELADLCVVNNGKATGRLCPRNPQVRERAARYARELMETYGVDGLKMDFLDTGGVPMQMCEATHKHTGEFVSDGVTETMGMMSEAMRKVKKDAIIEYRLNYATVATRKFATMLRGQDAPSDPDHVRRHLALLRAWSHGVPVHADYAYWTNELSEVNVAKFMAGMVFYGVPTISVDFDDVPKSHFAITKTWLDFYNRHLQRFITGQLDHLSDDFHYSTSRVSSDGFTYIPCFLREWPSALTVLPEHTRELYLANMTNRARILTRIEGVNGTYTVATADMMLAEKPGSQRFTAKNGALDIDIEVPIGGIMVLRKV